MNIPKTIHCLSLSMLLLAFLYNPALSQVSRFKGSLLAGLNLSQIDGDRLAGFNQPGAAAGIQVNTIFSTRWEMSMALQFAQQGARRNLNDDPAAAYARIRLNRVEVPVMLQFNEWKFQVGAGLSYSRLIRQRVLDSLEEDVSDQIGFRPDGLSYLFGGTFFFKPDTGFHIQWQKGLWSLLPAGSAQNRWISRNISLSWVHVF